MDLSTTIFAVGLLECRYRGSRIWTLPCLVGAPHHLRIPLPDLSIPLPRVCFMGAFGGIRTRVHTRPQGRESNKDSRPVRSTTDSYEDIPAGGFEHHRITEARDWLACHCWCMPTLTWSGRSVSDMPLGQDGQQPRELGESKVDMKKVQTKSPRFEPSNPLTIMPCTSKNVKSRHAVRGARERRTGGTTVAPYRFCRPAEACHAYATSRSYSHCTGIRIRAATQHTPSP